MSQHPTSAADAPGSPATSPGAYKTILGPLVGLSLPNLVVGVANTATTAFDAFYIGRLGTNALAGLSLVFPLMSLMIVVAISGIGGGTASAVARALGARQPGTASAVAVHSIIIALVASVFCTALAWTVAPAGFAALGATGEARSLAVQLANMLFGGAAATWLFCTFVAIVRGTGNMRLVALIIGSGSVLHVILAPLLIFGTSVTPVLGIKGLGLSYIIYHGLAATLLFAYLMSSTSRCRPERCALRYRVFWEVLRVGIPISANQGLLYLGVIIITGLMATGGSASVAAYGLATRLEFTQITLVNSIGAALVTLVGGCVGAREYRRGVQFAWAGAALAAALTGLVGITVTLFPELWLGLFTNSPDVLATGGTYLHIVGLSYPAYGVGLALLFASQGAGEVRWAVLAGVFRFIIAAALGWLLVRVWHFELRILFVAIAFGFLAYGATLALSVRNGALFKRNDQPAI